MIFCEYSNPSYYSDVIMNAMASQTTGVSIVCSTVCSGADQTSKPRVTSLCEGNPPVTVDSPHKGPVTRKMFPFGDVIMKSLKVMTMVGILSTLLSRLINYILRVPDDAYLCYGLAYHNVILRIEKYQCSSNIVQNLNCQNTPVRRL